jgi:hypothetical protein
LVPHREETRSYLYTEGLPLMFCLLLTLCIFTVFHVPECNAIVYQPFLHKSKKNCNSNFFFVCLFNFKWIIRKCSMNGAFWKGKLKFLKFKILGPDPVSLKMWWIFCDEFRHIGKIVWLSDTLYNMNLL